MATTSPQEAQSSSQHHHQENGHLLLSQIQLQHQLLNLRQPSHHLLSHKPSQHPLPLLLLNQWLLHSNLQQHLSQQLQHLHTPQLSLNLHLLLQHHPSQIKLNNSHNNSSQFRRQRKKMTRARSTETSSLKS